MYHDTIDFETLRGFLAERHSTRKYEDRDLTPEMLSALVQAASYIPSGGNRHAHGFTVITRGETRARLMKELTRIYRRRSALLNSAILRVLARPFVDPIMREFLRDKEYAGRMRALIKALDGGEDSVFFRAPAALVIHSPVLIPTPKEDCVIAGFVVSLAAQAMGLGACFVTLGQNAINASARCKAVLGLPASERVHAVVVVGFAAAAEHNRAQRPAKEIRYA